MKAGHDLGSLWNTLPFLHRSHRIYIEYTQERSFAIQESQTQTATCVSPQPGLLCWDSVLST